MVDRTGRVHDDGTPSGKEPYHGGLIARACESDGGRVIKLMDNAHNSLPRRTCLLEPEQASLGQARYPLARRTLLAKEQQRRGQGLSGTFPTDPDEFMEWAIALDTDLTARMAQPTVEPDNAGAGYCP